jgi:hypothetical protein
LFWFLSALGDPASENFPRAYNRAVVVSCQVAPRQ